MNSFDTFATVGKSGASAQSGELAEDIGAAEGRPEGRPEYMLEAEVATAEAELGRLVEGLGVELLPS